MKAIALSLFFMLLFSTFELSAQKTINFSTLGNEKTLVNSSHSGILSSPPKGKYDKIDIKDEYWDVAYSYLGVKHGNEFSKSRKDSIKHQKTLHKFSQKNATKSKLDKNDKEDNMSSGQRVVIDPEVELDFKGNSFNGWTPPDNNIAVIFC